MIQRIGIRNFRCIREATIGLGPLTVLVGPNASGKSTVLQALAPQQNLGPTDAWMKDPHAEINVDVTESGRAGRRRFADGRLYQWDVFYAHQLLRLDVRLLRLPNQLQFAPRLSSAGENLSNVFGSLTRKEKAAVAEHLCRLVPVFSDVDVTPVHSGMHVLRFQDRWNPNVWYMPEEVSDGTMLIAAFLTLQSQQDRPDLLAIEEPDRGLHPYLVNQLVSFLRQLSVGDVGNKHPIQVVLATHSAELLDYVRPEEVRFLSRNRETGAVEVYQVDPNSPDWKAAYDEYRESLGSIWLSGGVGGVPGA